MHCILTLPLRAITIAVLATLASAASQNAEAGQRALLIGIEEYQHVAQLTGAVDDANRMHDFLLEHMGFRPNDITVLTNQQATHRGIAEAIRQNLIAGTQPGDRVVLYYSGHGGQVQDLNGDEEDNLDETLVPVDAYADRPENHNQLTDDEFGGLISQLSDRDVTIIIDACHSGTITRGINDTPLDGNVHPRTPITGGGARASAEAVMAHRQEESYIVASSSLRIWSAAAAYQYAWEENDQGLFTTYFIEGAGSERRADANKNGVVSNAELIHYIRTKAEKWCAETPECSNLSIGFTPNLEATSDDMANVIVPVAFAPSQSQGDGADSGQSNSSGQSNGSSQSNSSGQPDNSGQSNDSGQSNGSGQPDNSGQSNGSDQASNSGQNGNGGSSNGGFVSEPTDIIVQDNDAGVAIQVLPSNHNTLGEQVQFQVSSDHPGWLILLDINANGEITQLIPNDLMTGLGVSHFIDTERPVTIPEQGSALLLTAQEPIGEGTLMAIVTEDNVPLSDLVQGSRDFSTVDDPQAYLASLAQSLMSIWRDETANRRMKWSMSTLNYTISR
jgi:hypothetical protein